MVALPFYISMCSAQGCQILHILTKLVILSCFFQIAILIGMKWYLMGSDLLFPNDY